MRLNFKKSHFCSRSESRNALSSLKDSLRFLSRDCVVPLHGFALSQEAYQADLRLTLEIVCSDTWFGCITPPFETLETAILEAANYVNSRANSRRWQHRLRLTECFCVFILRSDTPGRSLKSETYLIVSRKISRDASWDVGTSCNTTYAGIVFVPE